MQSFKRRAQTNLLILALFGLGICAIASYVGWTTSSLLNALIAFASGYAVLASMYWYNSARSRSRLASKCKVESAAAALAESAIDGAQVAMMFVDRNFVIQRVNKKTQELFRNHESDFRKLWPTFDASSMIGQCIDMFHKNPRHQRDLLADPAKLPHKADIRVGELAFSLQVSAQIDPQGNYVGNILEWADVTKQRQLEALDAAMNRSHLMVEFNTDGVILNANDNLLKGLEYALTDIVGKPHQFLLNRNITSGEGELRFWADLKSGQHCAGEFLCVTKDGREVWLQAIYNPIKDQRGNTIKIVSLSTDITANKEMEFKIAQQQKQDELAAQQLRQHVNHILAVAERVSQRDYSQTLDIQGQDEIGKLATGLGNFFEEKRLAEQAEQTRAEHDRAVALDVEQRVAVVLTVVKAMAAGDFSVAIPQLGGDAIGQVAAELAKAVDAIRTALQSVQTVADTVSTAASQLNAASRDISAGAQTQASSLEETASSLEEITSTVKQNSDNAQQARQIAHGSRDVAERGGAVVNEAVVAMDEISRSSTRIAEIITTIDEIAFQTNLLALNAAVEAARAGEQGRGFAVVAAEVRNLAQRSACAAKEIKTLINDSVVKVQNGTELVNRSGRSLTDIVTSVKRLADIVAEIAAASKEQLSGVEQVNKAVSQMDRVTQGNAAQTEEMSSTANLLLSHSTELADLVGQFQLTPQGTTSSKNNESSKNRESGSKVTKKSKARRLNGTQPKPAPAVLDCSLISRVQELEF